jgi:alpha-mannosidase
MMTHMVRSGQNEDIIGDGMQPLELLTDNVQFSAFKCSYDGSGYILRFYENQGRNAEVLIRLNGFSKAFLSNMNEDILEEIKIRDGVISINVGIYKVMTLMLER